MRSSTTVRVLAVSAAVLAGWACDLGGVGGGSSGVGAPCDVDSDCDGGLACDEHGGKGSCQKPHGHGESESESESDSDSTSTTGSSTSNGPTSSTEPATDSTTEPNETEAETGTETGTETETEGDTESAETGDDSSSTGDGPDPQACEALCACMLLNCSSYEAYPYADNDSCIAACEGLEPAVVQCYGGFCEQAANEPNEGLAEHWCEHAWGELGDAKC